MQWGTPARLEGSRASRELRRTYLNEMTVLSVTEVSQRIFQRLTDAGYIDFSRQSLSSAEASTPRTRPSNTSTDLYQADFFNDPPPPLALGTRDEGQS